MKYIRLVIASPFVVFGMIAITISALILSGEHRQRIVDAVRGSREDI